MNPTVFLECPRLVRTVGLRRLALALLVLLVSGCSPDDTKQESGFLRSESQAFWISQSKLLASDGQAVDWLGEDVAISGETAILGAPYDDDAGANSGAAYVFVRTGTIWTQQQKLVANDAVTNKYFGHAVAISGDTALIGAPFDNNRGWAYVFTRTGTLWSQQQKLGPGNLDSRLAISVSISGDTALLGAEVGSFDRGEAEVWVRTGSTWAMQQRLLASDGAIDDYFGHDVSLSGDTALIGAYGDDDGGTYGGSGYVFVRSGTTWTEQQKLLPSGQFLGGENRGYSVSLSGDTALLGAYGDTCDVGGGGNCGAVYAFVRTGTAWSLQQKLKASDEVLEDWFGFDVAVSGDTAFVASRDGGIISAYVFTRAGGVWNETQKPLPNGLATGDGHTYSVAVSGTVAVLGVPGDDDRGNDAGAAYILSADPLADGMLCPEGPLSCASGICKDGVCCTTACTGTCQRCNGTPGTCTTVTSADDADTCTGSNTCDATGACKKKTGQTCSAGSECATGNCSNGYCCNQPCAGGCDVCNATPGTCTLIGAGNPGESPSCSAYLCTGASAPCPTPCTSDAGCISTHYCSSGGTCEPRKSQASTCDDTAGQDCLQGGCRVCEGTGNGFCVDGRCCDSACAAPCDVCSAAIGQGPNGTCDTADEG